MSVYACLQRGLLLEFMIMSLWKLANLYGPAELMFQFKSGGVAGEFLIEGWEWIFLSILEFGLLDEAILEWRIV